MHNKIVHLCLINDVITKGMTRKNRISDSICFALSTPSIAAFFKNALSPYLKKQHIYYLTSLDELIQFCSSNNVDRLVIEACFDEINWFRIIEEYQSFIPGQIIICNTYSRLEYDIRLFQKPVIAAIDQTTSFSQILSILFSEQIHFHHYPMHLQRERLNETRDIRFIPVLSEDERRLIDLICAEKTIQEIGMQLRVTVSIVKKNRSKLYRKLGVKSAVGLALFAERNKLIKKN